MKKTERRKTKQETDGETAGMKESPARERRMKKIK